MGVEAVREAGGEFDPGVDPGVDREVDRGVDTLDSEIDTFSDQKPRKSAGLRRQTRI